MKVRYVRGSNERAEEGVNILVGLFQHGKRVCQIAYSFGKDRVSNL